MDGFIFSLGRILNYSGDLLLVLIPVVAAIILIVVFVLPKHPKIGAGLLAGTGIIGFFLLRSRLKNAFSLEERISKYPGAISGADINSRGPAESFGSALWLSI